MGGRPRTWLLSQFVRGLSGCRRALSGSHFRISCNGRFGMRQLCTWSLGLVLSGALGCDSPGAHLTEQRQLSKQDECRAEDVEGSLIYLSPDGAQDAVPPSGHFYASRQTCPLGQRHDVDAFEMRSDGYIELPPDDEGSEHRIQYEISFQTDSSTGRSEMRSTFQYGPTTNIFGSFARFKQIVVGSEGASAARVAQLIRDTAALHGVELRYCSRGESPVTPDVCAADAARAVEELRLWCSGDGDPEELMPIFVPPFELCLPVTDYRDEVVVAAMPGGWVHVADIMPGAFAVSIEKNHVHVQDPQDSCELAMTRATFDGVNYAEVPADGIARAMCLLSDCATCELD